MDQTCLADKLHFLSRYLKQIERDIKTTREDTENLRERTLDARRRARFIGAIHSMTMALISIQSSHKGLHTAIRELDEAPTGTPAGTPTRTPSTEIEDRIDSEEAMTNNPLTNNLIGNNPPLLSS
jgi:hypothetical protein